MIPDPHSGDTAAAGTRPPFAFPGFRAVLARLFLFWSLLLATPCAWSQATALQEVRLGVLSFRSPEQTAAQWQPLADYLTQRVSGYHFRVIPLFYPDLDRAVANHELDLVLTNPEHYVLLRSRHSLAAQATLMPLAGGYPVNQFGGVILTRANRDDLQDFADLRGKHVASVGEASLGGYLMQRWALMQADVDITRDLAELRFTGMPHDRVVNEVLAGRADAGFVRTGVIESMIKEGRLNKNQIKLLRQAETPEFPQLLSTDLYPEWPLSATSGTPGWFAKRVVQALFELEPDSAAAKAGNFFGFAPAGDYSQIENIMVKLRVHPDFQLTLDQVLERYSPWLFFGLTALTVAVAALVLSVRLNRRLRAALEKAERLSLRDTLLESLGEGVIGIDGAGRISFINAAALASLGYSRDEALGRDLHGVIHHHHPDGSDYAYSECPVLATLKTGQPYSGEERYFRKNGEGFPVKISTRPLLDAEGNVRGTVMAFQDITLEKHNLDELERYRHQLEELVARRTSELASAMNAAQSANQAKSAFLANMSHEIRTPMNAIVGLTHLLRRDIGDPTQQNRLAKVAEAARHLLGIINDILDFSKIEAGKLDLETTDFTLEQVIQNVADLVDDKLREKRLPLRREIDPRLSGMLRGDPTRLSQILLNYLSNACKFTEHGELGLSVRLLEESGEDMLVRFEVADTGIGIPAERLSRLFRSFEQADSSTTRRFGGTGLGLAISRRLAELMGGEAGADSAPGQGSRFWFTVRLRPGETATVTREPAPAPLASGDLLATLRGRRVLLVEDNLINQEVALELLGEVGIRADLAGDGREALEKARLRNYELILMDIQMPIMDGRAATTAIRHLPGHATTPILAMTAGVFAEEQRQCMEAGMNDMVSKPVDPRDLYATLVKWLPERRQATPVPAPAPAGEVDESAIAALATIPGLDVRGGLRSVRGRIASYTRLLYKFAHGAEDEIRQLREASVDGDRAPAIRAAHSLKGASGTLGVTRIRQQATELETWLRDGNPDEAGYSRRIGALIQEFAAFQAGLRAAVPDPDTLAENGSPERTGDSVHLLALLDSLLAANDMQALTLLRDAYPQFARLLPGEVLEQLHRRVEAYDFDAALDALRANVSRLADVAT